MRGQFKIGSPSSPISIVQLTGMYGNYEMAITITADDCIPVTQTLYGYSEDKSCKIYLSRSMTKQKMTCAPSEDSDQPGHPPCLIRVTAVRMKKPEVLSYT